ncbi:MAG: IS630 family transposase [Albidovulum sp.]|nr:IS630 family transposase [Albidovulum sp.]
MRLERIRTDPQSFLKHASRAEIILHLGSGRGLAENMRRTGRSNPTVWSWRDRFLVGGIGGILYDARPPGLDPVAKEKAEALAGRAISPPPKHASHWTARALAGKLGMVASRVRNILKRNGLKLHIVKTFEVSRDPRFESNIRDVVGLYVNPPNHAIAQSVDEKTQIQALGQTQAPLPMKPEHPEPRTHVQKRNGTTSLMVALDVAAGKVVGQTVRQHRSEEFLAFLDRAGRGIKRDADMHVVLYNVSRANAVRGFFSNKLSRQRLRNAVFNSREECVAAIEGRIEHHNANDA